MWEGPIRYYDQIQDQIQDQIVTFDYFCFDTQLKDLRNWLTNQSNSNNNSYGNPLVVTPPGKINVSSVHWHLQVLSKKENKNGVMSPESPEQDSEYTLTPRTEAKYSKIDEDFQIMMQRNQQLAAGQRVMSGGNYTLPVTVPIQGSYNESGMLQASPQMAHQNISPRPSSSETDSGKLNC